MSTPNQEEIKKRKLVDSIMSRNRKYRKSIVVKLCNDVNYNADEALLKVRAYYSDSSDEDMDNCGSTSEPEDPEEDLKLPVTQVVPSKRQTNFSSPQSSRLDPPAHASAGIAHEKSKPSKNFTTSTNLASFSKLKSTKLFLAAYEAMKRNDLKSFEDLIVSNPNLLFEHDRNGRRTLLHYTVHFDHSRCKFAALLLKKQTQFDPARLGFARWRPFDATNRGPLHEAAKFNNAEMIDFFAKEKQTRTTINSKSDSGRTPLHDAAQSGAVDAVNALTILDDCDVEIADNNGYTPLLLAASELHADVAVKLLMSGANIHACRPRDGFTVFEIARENGPVADGFLAELKHAMDSIGLKAQRDQAITRWLSNKSFRKSIFTRSRELMLSRFMDTDFGIDLMESVRNGAFDIAGSSYFDESSLTEGKQFSLCQALAYSSQMAVCEEADIKEALGEYESAVLNTNEIHPLYFLAHARLALRSDPLIASSLFHILKKNFPGFARSIDQGGWLTEEEIKVFERKNVPFETPSSKDSSQGLRSVFS